MNDFLSNKIIFPCLPIQSSKIFISKKPFKPLDSLQQSDPIYRDSENKIRAIRGKGCLIRTEEGKLQAQLNIKINMFDLFAFFYTNNSKNNKKNKDIIFSDKDKGKILDEKDFFHLSIIDSENRVWESKKSLVKSISSSLFGCHHQKVKILIPEIICNSEIHNQTQESILLLDVGKEISLPKTWSDNQNQEISSHVFENGIKVSLFKKEGNFFLKCISTDLSEFKKNNIESRLCEALQFLLGQPVRWFSLALFSREEAFFRIRTSSYRPILERIEPPISLEDVLKGSEVYQITPVS